MDVWAEEELKTGTLSNGTVENYLGTIRNIKKHPLAERKLKNVTSEHLQSFFDLLSFGGVHPDGKERKGYSKDYIHSFSAVMQQSFRFAVFPKQYITFNPMQYIKLRYQTDEVDLFSDEDMDGNIQPISRKDYERLLAYLQKKNPAAILPDGKERKGYSKDYIHSFSAVMQQSFRFAVFPKQYITFNPMQYIKLRYQTDEVDLFSDEDMDGNVQPISREDYERLLAYLQKKNPAAILPIQIAYYAGLRIGEACGLAWQDVNLEEQCLTIRRSIRYDGSKRKYIIGPTKRKKVRVVDFGDTLVEIFRNARKEQLKNRMQYGELYHTNYYKEVKEKNRVYYEYYCLDRTEEVPTDYKEISFVCLRPDGCLELPTTLGTVCRKVAKTLEGFEGFHFHQLRHTYTSNLLANGAAPKDVQELLGHSDVSTTMNVYAHSTRDAKRKSVRLLDKVVGND
nr:site-specific integrase [Dorea longicatena]